MGRKEAHDFLQQFVLEQMCVPDIPHHPMNDLRKIELLRHCHPRAGQVTVAFLNHKVGAEVSAFSAFRAGILRTGVPPSAPLPTTR